MPEPEPEPEVLDFTGLTEEEIKVKKKEAKRREKARIMAQLAAIEEAKTRLNDVGTRAPANREGKRQARAVSAGEILHRRALGRAAQAPLGEEAQDGEAGEAGQGRQGDHAPHAED